MVCDNLLPLLLVTLHTSDAQRNLCLRNGQLFFLLACHFSLALAEKEDGNVTVAKEQIRQAVRAELGKDVPDAGSAECFLQSENQDRVIHTAFEGNSQIVLWLMATGEEELLAVAQEEVEK